MNEQNIWKGANRELSSLLFSPVLSCSLLFSLVLSCSVLFSPVLSCSLHYLMPPIRAFHQWYYGTSVLAPIFSDKSFSFERCPTPLYSILSYLQWNFRPCVYLVQEVLHASDIRLLLPLIKGPWAPSRILSVLLSNRVFPLSNWTFTAFCSPVSCETSYGLSCRLEDYRSGNFALKKFALHSTAAD